MQQLLQRLAALLWLLTPLHLAESEVLLLLTTYCLPLTSNYLLLITLLPT